MFFMATTPLLSEATRNHPFLEMPLQLLAQFSVLLSNKITHQPGWPPTCCQLTAVSAMATAAITSLILNDQIDLKAVGIALLPLLLMQSS
jgi:hypothetical protein